MRREEKRFGSADVVLEEEEEERGERKGAERKTHIKGRKVRCVCSST